MFTTVSSSETLLAAIQTAKAGDTIALTAGNYGTINLNGLNPTSAITITSADPGHPAVVAGVYVTNSSNFVISNLESTMDVRGFGLSALNSKNITFDNMDVHGKAVGDGNGGIVRNSTGVTFSNSEFHNLGTGLGHIDTSGVSIAGNSFHDLQADAIHGGGSSNIAITGNQFTNFFPKTGDHPDAIQFWTTNTTASAHDITVKDNVFVRGTGEVTQGIFMGNELGIPYKNVVIAGNAIVGAMYNGILVTVADNVRISGNLVEGYADMNSWIQISKVTNSSLDNNVASSYGGTMSITGLTTWGNSTIPLGAMGDMKMLDKWLAEHGETLDQRPPPPVNPDPVATMTDADNDGRIMGSSGADVIGDTGADTMSGGAGNDVYLIDSTGDKIVEVATAGGGVDTARSILATYTLANGVENLVLSGTGAQVGIGNAANNVLTSNGIRCDLDGGAGNDTLVSKGGIENLTGGLGNDVFCFTKLSSNVAQVKDFVVGCDKLDLSQLLDPYTGTNPVADGWVKFATDATGTSVMVDIDGPGGSADFVTVAKLCGVTTALKAGADWLF